LPPGNASLDECMHRLVYAKCVICGIILLSVVRSNAYSHHNLQLCGHTDIYVVRVAKFGAAQKLKLVIIRQDPAQEHSYTAEFDVLNITTKTL
jgi:hypothetical protein